MKSIFWLALGDLWFGVLVTGAVINILSAVAHLRDPKGSNLGILVHCAIGFACALGALQQALRMLR